MTGTKERGRKRETNEKKGSMEERRRERRKENVHGSNRPFPSGFSSPYNPMDI